MAYNPNQEEFERKLRGYLEQSGRSQTWTAKQLGYQDRSILLKWMTGEAQMPLSALNRFCDLFALNSAEKFELIRLAGHNEVTSLLDESAKNATKHEDLFELLNQKSAGLRRYLRTQEFQNLVNEHTRAFVGRQFIFQAIDKLLQNPQLPSGYIIIQGEPGIGKTALMAQMVKQHAYAHHFNVAVQNIRTAADFLANVCAQLIIKYELPHRILPPEATQDSGFLVQLLGEAVTKIKDQPVVMLVDALDEAEDTGLHPGANRLLLPPVLPIGAFFIITTREQADYRLFVEHREDIYVRDDDPNNLADMRRYLEGYLHTYPAQMQARIAQWGVTSETFIDVITEKSQGNFMYLVYVLRDIRDGRLTATTLDNIHLLPRGLRGYYQRHWRIMRDQDESRFEKYYEPVVCYLATAREPVKLEQLVEWTKLPPKRIKKVINDWREFLNVKDDAAGDVRYYLYHTSFQDFLQEEVGLTRYHDGIVQTALNKIPGF